MRKLKKLLVLAIFCSALDLFGGSNLLRCQVVAAQGKERPPTHQRWEYSAIVNNIYTNTKEGADQIVGIAMICYFESGGCRSEEVRVDYSMAEYAKEFNASGDNAAYSVAAGVTAANRARSKAIAKLGEKGWEMVGEARAENYYGEEGAKRVLYFKRAK